MAKRVTHRRAFFPDRSSSAVISSASCSTAHGFESEPRKSSLWVESHSSPQRPRALGRWISLPPGLSPAARSHADFCSKMGYIRLAGELTALLKAKNEITLFQLLDLPAPNSTPPAGSPGDMERRKGELSSRGTRAIASSPPDLRRRLASRARSNPPRSLLRAGRSDGGCPHRPPPRPKAPAGQ